MCWKNGGQGIKLTKINMFNIAFVQRLINSPVINCSFIQNLIAVCVLFQLALFFYDVDCLTLIP
jgi:hypothetical protein